MRAPLARHVVAFAIALSAAAHAQIRIADQPGLGSFSSLQAAITAAPAGGLLLVQSGTYGAAVIDGKSLSIVEVPGAFAKTSGTLTIRNIGAAKRVLVSGFEIKGVGAAGVVLESSAGHVRLVECAITGGVLPGTQYSKPGAPGVKLTDCAKVVAVNCTITGGNALPSSGDPGAAGGAGVESLDSNVALFDSSARGGKGAIEGTPGGAGGDGCHVVGWGLVASGSTITGGAAGGGDYIGCNEGGVGGDALEVNGAQAQLLDVALVRGAGGWSSCGGSGAPGNAITNTGGTVNQFAGTRRKLTSVRLSSDDTRITLTVLGEPGDRFFLAHSAATGFQFQSAWHGVWLLPSSSFGATRSFGTIPASGALDVAVRLADFSPAAFHELRFLQGYCVDAAGEIFLTSPVQIEVLDRRSAPDCDFDGDNDFVSVLLQMKPDCNRNLAPDGCDIAAGFELDCDLNGVPDACDIASGGAEDCNGNAVPDACDFLSGAAQDCNGNGVPDSCDLASNFSSDFDGNGIPDECQGHVPTTLWIDAAAPVGGNGTQASPFQNLREGIDAAFHGDALKVRDGLYVGPDNRDLDPEGRRILIESENGPTACVIDCQFSGRAFQIDSGETLNCVIKGFTIKNGDSAAAWEYTSNGGAMFIHHADVTVIDCVFESCRARLGGAIWASSTRAVIRDCTFVSCTALPLGGSLGRGGAVSLNGGTPSKRPQLIGSRFVGCSAEDGGALDVGGYATTRVSHCEFIGNTAEFGGAVLATSYTSANVPFLEMDDCLFAGNSGVYGGAVAMGATYTYPQLPGWAFVNCTFVGNSASTRGGVFHVWGNNQGVPPLELSNSIVRGNTSPLGATMFHYGGDMEIRVSSSDVEGGQAGFAFDPTASLVWASNNIDVDPQFVDGDGLDNNAATYADNDYRLALSSPCIDAGDFALVPADAADIDGDGNVTELIPLDLDGAARFVDVASVPDTGAGPPPVIDLGCYERP